MNSMIPADFKLGCRKHTVDSSLPPGKLMRLIIGQGWRRQWWVLANGSGASLMLTRLMKSLLFGVSATDPFVFAAIPLLLGMIALLACYVPARRAMRVDPVTALRHD
jgi:putative ABC transport system permease protein